MIKQRTTDRLEQTREMWNGDRASLKSRNVDRTFKFAADDGDETGHYSTGYHFLKIGKARGRALYQCDLVAIKEMIEAAISLDRTT